MANFTRVDYLPIRVDMGETTRPFRHFVQAVLPTVYDDSLSYYELLNKVVATLNSVITNMNGVMENTDNLRTAYAQLQEFVNGYFESMDVQQEINAKLDAMAMDSAFLELFRPLLEEAFGPIIEEKVEDEVDRQLSARIYVDGNRLVIE